LGSRVVIHCKLAIPWQPVRAKYFAEGFERRGIPYTITDSPVRTDSSSVPLLLGTSRWKTIEADGGDYLLVDRCSFGDTDKYVSLVWNGHGRRGNHRVPAEVDGSRWEAMGHELKPWQPRGSRIVLCGQTETYSPHYQTLEEWYRDVPATNFRKHPSGENPTGLPDAADFEDSIAVTLNSSIGVKCVLAGIPTITMDEGAMAWDVTGHSLDDIRMPDRTFWAWRLAWTQHSDDEIREGKLWDWLL
jgi:hypothetical protein